MAAVWLPQGHAAYWAKYGAHAREVATLYDGARFFWGVPDYVPAEAVNTIADLAKAEIAARMSKTVQGVGLGATISVFSQKAITSYGLDRLGYSFRPGSQSEWIAAYEKAVAERRWLVFPTWAPQYLNRGGKIRPLADPYGVMGGINRGVLASPGSRWAMLPARTRTVLNRIHLGLEGVTEMDWMVNMRSMAPADAASLCLNSNRKIVDRWFEE